MPTVADEHVVLLDGFGRPAGTVPKRAVHTSSTPLHLAFSCHVVRADGCVLLARRSPAKRTWPGVWSNACCGHPQDGETLRDAVTRRLAVELGLRPTRLAIEIPDFVYRAVMDDGTVEHELCPVVIAEVAGPPCPDPNEVDGVEWIRWPELRARALHTPESLSPWAVEQVRTLDLAAWQPGVWSSGDSFLNVPPIPGRTAPPDTAIDPFASVCGPLERTLEDFVARKAREAAAVDPALADVVGEIGGLVNAGGKRLRPAFVHWGHRACGGASLESVACVGGAIELLHTFALLHDDVMDKSVRRRGRATAHVTFARRHAERRMLGDPNWFGTSVAILVGDLAFVWADELLDDARLPPGAMARARRVFNSLRAEVMAGQYLDLLHAAEPTGDEMAARRVALLKSARYTVTRPLQLGAALVDGDLDPRLDVALQSYGDAVGVAFQLRDDVLGLFGDPSHTGKGTLEDLREGKRTLLVLRARRLADAGQRDLLEASLGDPTVDEDRAEEVRSIVASTGALASVELLIEHQLAIAIEALDAVPEPAKSALRSLALLAVRRSS